ncbi:ABC transporter ced-7 [Bulinus truncatus]|nr:ABC transporter ced-7 [Bulinus truncatus]
MAKKDEDVVKLLRDFGLSENVVCGSLSASDKRKLSIACSFVGDSRIILLDEPFKGLDPWAKPDVQSLLRDKKDGRTVLLTTENVEEAVEAGDRMVIMSGGQVKAYGALSYLKKLYGTGYHINIFTESE